MSFALYPLCHWGTWWCWGFLDTGLAGETTHGIVSEEEAEHEDSALHVKGGCRTGNPGHGYEYGFSRRAPLLYTSSVVLTWGACLTETVHV